MCWPPHAVRTALVCQWWWWTMLSPICVQLGLDLVTAKAITFYSVSLHGRRRFPSGQKCFIIGWRWFRFRSVLPSKGTNWPKPHQQNVPHSNNRAMLTVVVKCLDLHGSLSTPHMLRIGWKIIHWTISISPHISVENYTAVSLQWTLFQSQSQIISIYSCFYHDNCSSFCLLG